MDMKLNHDEISALQSLDLEHGQAMASVREDELPKKLFEFNLVSRRKDGPAVITKSGQRALFRHECVAALEALESGGAVAPGSGVEKWLVASGFARLAGEAGAMAITPRGRMWLRSFEPEAEVATPSLSAESFAARRA